MGQGHGHSSGAVGHPLHSPASFDPFSPHGQPGDPRWWHLSAVLVMGIGAALNMSGWFTKDILPDYDFAGYASAVEYVRDAVLRHGRVPSWCTKWFAGSTQFMSSLKEILALPLASWLGPVRGTQVLILVLKVAAGLAMYGVCVRCFHAPMAGILAGYAYAFSMASNYAAARGHVDVAVSSVLFPLILVAATALWRQREGRWAIVLGVLVSCQLSVNYLQAGVSLLLLGLVLILRPWRCSPNEDSLVNRPLVRRWVTLTAAAAAVAIAFSGSQLAWFALDAPHHALHSSEHIAWGRRVFVEHSPFAYVNRNNWLGPWLAHHHPPDMPLFPDHPLRNQRHYLGAVAMIVCAAGWFAARRVYALRRWYQLLVLAFLIQYWLAVGPRTLVWQVARTFHWPERVDRALYWVLTGGALGCLTWLVLRLRHRTHAAKAVQIDVALGVGGLCVFASHSLFNLLERAVPLLAHVRAPGHFFDLAPFSFYALFSVALVAIGHRLQGRPIVRGVLGAAVGAALVVDFWPGTAAFDRGTPLAPVREFRTVMAELPAQANAPRLGMSPWSEQSGVASLVAARSELGAAWSWLPWQAGRHWPAYWRATMLWLADEVHPQRAPLFRSMGNTLSRIGRVKYVLDEIDGDAHMRFREPWRLRAANDRFAVWERPDVMPMAYGSRSYVLFVGDDDLVAAVSVYRAFEHNALVVAGGRRLSDSPVRLVNDASAILAAGTPALADEDSRVLARRLGAKLMRTNATMALAPSVAPLPEIRAAPLVEVSYRRTAPDHIILETDAGEDQALVFVSEAYHPWWRATVDGRRGARVLRTQMAFMGVRVDPGRHVIDMRLQLPALVSLADWTTTASWVGLLGWALAGAIAWVGRSRRR